jgi:hypothetical protein
MIGLIGREPDSKACASIDGYYLFRYEPKDKAEASRLGAAAATLQEWLSIFDLVPLRSMCFFGRLPHPQEGQEGKDYLCIFIHLPMQKHASTEEDC